MTLAQSEADWLALANRFSKTEIADLRQRVIERFLEECPKGKALKLFAVNTMKMCIYSISLATAYDVHRQASHMHWVLSCLTELDNKAVIFQEIVVLFNKKFDKLPLSVQGRIQNIAELIRTR
jgi:hypothetical protein